jgi:hypothetical protein
MGSSFPRSRSSRSQYGSVCTIIGIILLFAAILKAPSDKIPEIIKTLVEKPLVWSLAGWITTGILLLGSGILFAIMRRIYLNEIDRLKRERDQLQETLTEQRLQHSRFKGGGKHEQ